jgi:hypothetical protein
MSALRIHRVVGVRGTATPDELAALLAALAHRPAPVDDDRYEQWRRSRVVALARTTTCDPSRQPCQIPVHGRPGSAQIPSRPGAADARLARLVTTDCMTKAAQHAIRNGCSRWAVCPAVHVPTSRSTG